MLDIKKIKAMVFYWVVNIFSAITTVLLIYFSTLGILLNYKLPEKLYLFETISIRYDIIIFFIIFVSAIISIKTIKANAETEAVEQWLKLIESERNKQNDR